MKKALVLAATAGIIASSASAQVTKTRDGYVLRVKYSKGSTLQYRLDNKVDGDKGSPGVGTKFMMPVRMRVLKVENGLADVELKLGEVKMGEAVLVKSQTAVVRLNNRNQGPKGEEGGAGNMGAQLPLAPLRVGQSWSAMAPVKSMAGGGTLNATYTFAGLNTIHGRPVAVVTYKVNGYATGAGRLCLLISDGTLFSNDVKMKLTLGSNLIVTSTLTRL